MSTLVIVYLFQGPAWIFANMCVCIMETWSNIYPKFVKVLFHLSVSESLHQRECLKKKKVFSTEETTCPLKVPAYHMRKRNLGLRNRKTNKKQQAKKPSRFLYFFAHYPPHWWWTQALNWGCSSIQSRGQFEIILETNERLYICCDDTGFSISSHSQLEHGCQNKLKLDNWDVVFKRCKRLGY